MAVPIPCATAAAADGSNDGEQPENDYIKMFVGQIPRAMNEQDLMDMFGEFGRVYQLNLLRDKFTGVSKGKTSARWFRLLLLLILEKKKNDRKNFELTRLCRMDWKMFLLFIFFFFYWKTSFVLQTRVSSRSNARHCVYRSSWQRADQQQTVLCITWIKMTITFRVRNQLGFSVLQYFFFLIPVPIPVI